MFFSLRLAIQGLRTRLWLSPRMKRKQTDIRSHFAGGSRGKRVHDKGELDNIIVRTNPDAEALGKRLGAPPTYLTPDAASWYILAEKWWQPPGNRDFVAEWSRHPTTRHALKLYGKVVHENRWSQSWGVSSVYSGSTNRARPIEEESMVEQLIARTNQLTRGLFSLDEAPYNGCLQNWYEIEHTIGLHADDEKILRSEYPVFSLSWGGTRRFMFRPRDRELSTIDIYLRDGDLLVMGGASQKTHRHEVPKWRKTMDPATSNRINWTIRAFHET